MNLYNADDIANAAVTEALRACPGGGGGQVMHGLLQLARTHIFGVTPPSHAAAVLVLSGSACQSGHSIDVQHCHSTLGLCAE